MRTTEATDLSRGPSGGGAEAPADEPADAPADPHVDAFQEALAVRFSERLELDARYVAAWICGAIPARP